MQTKKYFDTERFGEEYFKEIFGINQIVKKTLNTDGIVNGVLFEFKKGIDNYSSTLFQAIKYLSNIRIRGLDIPGDILLVSLNDRKIYRFKSEDFREEIEKVYKGGASKGNEKFVTNIEPEMLNLDWDNFVDRAVITNIIKENNYLKTNVDEHNVVALALRYYEETKARKGDFLNEIRYPKHFKYIIPYEKEDNEEFKYLMDILNDKFQKKELGAFYTPIPYVKKAHELLYEAIGKIPEGNDYIILDRCAGTGNLLEGLSEEILSHYIISTYEYHEWVILNDLYGGKVRHIVPPMIDRKKHVSNGFVISADALSEEFIKNEDILKYVNDENTNVIVFENPPYRDLTTSGEGTKESFKKISYIKKEAKKELTGATLNDILNLFVWSAFEYYIKKENDSLILFAPIKYWKNSHIVKKEFVGGFIFNRKHFKASPSAIACVSFNNVDKNEEEMTLKAYDLEDNKLKFEKELTIKKVYKQFSSMYFDKREFPDDEDGIYVNTAGVEILDKKASAKPIYNKNIIGHLRTTSFNLDGNSGTLVRAITYSGHGFYLRNDNFLEKLPLFVAKKFPQNNWYEKDIYATTADKGLEYLKDKVLEKQSLIFVALSNYNKILSFLGSDKRMYYNELCFDKKPDGTDTLAIKYINEAYEKGLITEEEDALIKKYQELLRLAKLCDGSERLDGGVYNPKLNYGVYQIAFELNTRYKIEDKYGKVSNYYHYPRLNTVYKELQTMLWSYYDKNIVPKLFKYELLK